MFSENRAQREAGVHRGGDVRQGRQCQWDWDYRENDRLGGHEPYGVSKACAELVVDAYRRSFLTGRNVGIASVRAGNIIGGGDWASERLIPDIVRAFSAGNALVVRSPTATRPWQHVLEPLRGYLSLAQRLYVEPVEFGGGWNFGPSREDHKPVSWIADRCVRLWEVRTARGGARRRGAALRAPARGDVCSQTSAGLEATLAYRGGAGASHQLVPGDARRPGHAG